ncbi:MAG: hypothetical protein NC907_05870, partial [Candidatus Omnitrophica bacterium]|nr:hypothetical protein [Candidatus Omnitrophota bacterium]
MGIIPSLFISFSLGILSFQFMSWIDSRILVIINIAGLSFSLFAFLKQKRVFLISFFFNSFISGIIAGSNYFESVGEIPREALEALSEGRIAIRGEVMSNPMKTEFGTISDFKIKAVQPITDYQFTLRNLGMFPSRIKLLIYDNENVSIDEGDVILVKNLRKIQSLPRRNPDIPVKKIKSTYQVYSVSGKGSFVVVRKSP